MSYVTLAASFLMLMLQSANLAAMEDCDFDREFLAKRLETVAARNPGGVSDFKNSSVTWRLPTGETVVVAHGGCVDLGTAIRLKFTAGVKPSTKDAIHQLLAATSRYWSLQDSRNIASVLSARKFVTRVAADGAIEIEATPDPDSPFTFGFTIMLSGAGASVFWQEA